MPKLKNIMRKNSTNIYTPYNNPTHKPSSVSQVIKCDKCGLPYTVLNGKWRTKTHLFCSAISSSNHRLSTDKSTIGKSKRYRNWESQILEHWTLESKTYVNRQRNQRWVDSHFREVNVTSLGKVLCTIELVKGVDTHRESGDDFEILVLGERVDEWPFKFLDMAFEGQNTD